MVTFHSFIFFDKTVPRKDIIYLVFSIKLKTTVKKISFSLILRNVVHHICSERFAYIVRHGACHVHSYVLWCDRTRARTYSRALEIGVIQYIHTSDGGIAIYFWFCL